MSQSLRGWPRDYPRQMHLAGPPVGNRSIAYQSAERPKKQKYAYICHPPTHKVGSIIIFGSWKDTVQ